MTVYAQAVEVENRLASLRFPERHILEEAVRVGEVHRANCGPLVPRLYPGTTAWSHATEFLRVSLLPAGWLPVDVRNLPLIRHPEGDVQIFISSGKYGTGDPSRNPTTKYPKGPVVFGQVAENQRQLNLFPEFRRTLASSRAQGVVTWCLLIETRTVALDDTIGSSVTRCEISLPGTMDRNGWVTEWNERILLGDIRIDDRPLRQTYQDPDDDIDIPVFRR